MDNNNNNNNLASPRSDS